MTDLRLHMFQCGSLKCKLHNIKMNLHIATKGWKPA